jgi:hypothetical protein
MHGDQDMKWGRMFMVVMLTGMLPLAAAQEARLPSPDEMRAQLRAGLRERARVEAEQRERELAQAQAERDAGRLRLRIETELHGAPPTAGVAQSGR